MQAQTMEIKEQIVKTVVRSGNGGAVWVPKSWLGEEVVIILPQKPKLDARKKVMHLLWPFLKDIIAVGIYGSYARNEQAKDSDIDVMVITAQRPLKLDFKKEGLDIVSLPIDKLKIAMQKHPIIYHTMIQEAVPLINAHVFDGLRQKTPSRQSLKGYLQEAKAHLKSSKELLEMDKIDNEYLTSYSVLYSAMLRLRGVFIAHCILSSDRFSSKKFKNWLLKRGMSARQFDGLHRAYKIINDDKNQKQAKVSIQDAQNVLSVLENEIAELEKRINGK